MEYYRFDEYEITIPKIFGVIPKSIEINQSRRLWSDEEFMKDAKSKISADDYQIFCDLYGFTKQNSDKMVFGTGKLNGSFTYKFKDPRAVVGLVSVFTVYTNGIIQFRFSNIKDHIGDENCILFNSKLSETITSKRWDNKEILADKGFGPSLDLKTAFPGKEVLEAFKSMTLEYVNQVKEQIK